MNAPLKHLTVRNLPPRLARALEAECRRRGASRNQTVLDLLAQALGTGTETNGLEKLAGTWSDAEAAAFTDATADFERIDDEAWR